MNSFGSLWWLAHFFFSQYPSSLFSLFHAEIQVILIKCQLINFARNYSKQLMKKEILITFAFSAELYGHLQLFIV